MSNSVPTVGIWELLSLGWDGYFICKDALQTSEKPVFCIGNTYVPDHILTCEIPRQCGRTYPHKRVEVRVHVLWLETNGVYGYSGLVADKTDCNLYWMKLEIQGTHGMHMCAFQRATLEQIGEKASEHNVFLKNVIGLARDRGEALLDYQVYSGLSDRFYYVEIPYGDRVVTFGAGLHDQSLLSVGLIGKAMNRDFFVSYAECTPEVYEWLKVRTPSLYERAQQMEKNRPHFSYMNVFFEKRRKYSQLADILLGFREEPMSPREVAFLGASAYGTKMIQYYGPAFCWMESFVAQYRRLFR